MVAYNNINPSVVGNPSTAHYSDSTSNNFDRPKWLTHNYSTFADTQSQHTEANLQKSCNSANAQETLCIKKHLLYYITKNQQQ